MVSPTSVTTENPEPRGRGGGGACSKGSRRPLATTSTWLTSTSGPPAVGGSARYRPPGC